MFVRKKRNKSGSTSIQIIDKNYGKYRVIKTIGSTCEPDEIDYLWRKAHQLLPDIIGQTSLNLFQDEDRVILNFFKESNKPKVRVVGPERIFGTLFNNIGFNAIEDDLFRHLVITRLVYPGSKLKTIDYLRRYNGVDIDISKIYRFLDRLHSQYKERVEQISFDHSRRVLRGKISMVFYDMTTLYFESSDEDDLRITGFSKDGKHQNPQIYLGLLVGKQGYPIGYEIFEGNKFEGHTLIPVLEHFQDKFKLQKAIVIADAGLLSNENILELKKKGYKFILGGRVKNESDSVKEQILEQKWSEGSVKVFNKEDSIRLIVGYSERRAKKDASNRTKGLLRLEKKIKAGKLTKSSINNRGYNKYLKLTGQINIEIDYQKYHEDQIWDGLKGYVTNSKLQPKEVIENYNQLWHIEKAFRISKTDLKIRPIYHRLRNRIEAHICICFTAYSILKELERILKQAKLQISPQRTAELCQTIYELDIILPQSKKQESILLELDDRQQEIWNLFFG
jgi:transposase